METPYAITVAPRSSQSQHVAVNETPLRPDALVDAARVQNPPTDTINSVASDMTTSPAPVPAWSSATKCLASRAPHFEHTEDANESACVKVAPSSSTLRVVNAADIAGWSDGDTFSSAVTGITPGRVIVLDISPMVQIVLGRFFRQSACWVKPWPRPLDPSHAGHQRKRPRQLLRHPLQQNRQRFPHRPIHASSERGDFKFKLGI